MMMHRVLGDWATRSPAGWLAILGWLTAVTVQTGGLGVIDTQRRLQVTRSLWTGTPPVPPGDYPEFGLVGRGGIIYSWYGIGQSLVMLPADVLVGLILPTLPIPDSVATQVRSGVVAYLTFPLITAVTVSWGFRLLREMGFSFGQASSGILSWLFASSFLSYTQVHQENSVLLLLTTLGYVFLHRWSRTGSPFQLAVGTLALSLNLLVRLTAGVDLGAGMTFAGLMVWSTARTSSGIDWRVVRARAWQVAALAAPVVLVGIGLDRFYQWYRFGDVWTTYIYLYGEQARMLQPDLPVGYPFSGSFWAGFFGPFVSGRRSIFLFDPLLLLLAAVLVGFWRVVPFAVRATCGTLMASLVLTVVGYARLEFWDGASSWGNRYTLVPVHLLVLFAIPLLLRAMTTKRAPALRWVGIVVVALSVFIQVLSVLLPPSTESFQESHWGPGVNILRRMVNVGGVVTGKFDEWNLSCDGAMPAELAQIWLTPFSKRWVLGRMANAILVSWCALVAVVITVAGYTLTLALAEDHAGPREGCHRLSTNEHQSL